MAGAEKYGRESEFGQGDFPTSFLLKMSNACFNLKCFSGVTFSRNVNILLRYFGSRHSFATGDEEF